MYWLALSASAVISRIARLNSRVSYSSPIRSAAATNSLYSSGSANSAASLPSKRLVMKPALRDARLTILFTTSAFTR